MSSVLRVTTSFAVIVCLAGCTSQQVIFNPAASPSSERTASVWFDRTGAMYPDITVDESFAMTLHREHGDSLRSYFRTAHAAGRPSWSALISSYGVDSGLAFDDAWRAVQDSVAVRRARNAVRVARGGPLVVLIHGYNNPADSTPATYAAVRSHLERLTPSAERFGYLDVYWDGRWDRGSKARNFSAWTRAQHNAHGVGLGLRRLLNQIPDSVPVRILTHSHGGKVAAVALWNVTSSIGKTSESWRSWYDSTRVDPVRHAIPSHPDMRLGMLVPAMPGNVLSDFANGDVPPATSRIVVGLNPDDEVVGKRFIPGVVLRRWWGSTTLGSQVEEYAEHAAAVNRPGRPPVAYCVNFADGNDVHDWLVYMERPAIDRFLTTLFASQAQIPTGDDVCPGAQPVD